MDRIRATKLQRHGGRDESRKDCNVYYETKDDESEADEEEGQVDGDIDIDDCDEEGEDDDDESNAGVSTNAIELVHRIHRFDNLVDDINFLKIELVSYITRDSCCEGNNNNNDNDK